MSIANHSIALSNNKLFASAFIRIYNLHVVSQKSEEDHIFGLTHVHKHSWVYGTKSIIRKELTYDIPSAH